MTYKLGPIVVHAERERNGTLYVAGTLRGEWGTWGVDYDGTGVHAGHYFGRTAKDKQRALADLNKRAGLAQGRYGKKAAKRNPGGYADYKAALRDARAKLKAGKMKEAHAAIVAGGCTANDVHSYFTAAEMKKLRNWARRAVKRNPKKAAKKNPQRTVKKTHERKLEIMGKTFALRLGPMGKAGGRVWLQKRGSASWADPIWYQYYKTFSSAKNAYDNMTATRMKSLAGKKVIKRNPKKAAKKNLPARKR